MTRKKPKKQLNRYIVLTGIGLQMGITIYLGAQLGKWLDAKYSDNNVYTIIFTLLAIVLSFYSLLRQLKNLDN
ncbi:AtpZ/AtpI family protein [Lutimonas saemankumensis]|uniref:AtpZ/AtpI family protein n=1 Tax=Lutimonas saemankumensis TaxID=483016 RepID=UPI001CD6105B|nr:AtpZ/AtpI family protein [Lutimonas saemankumensis]MCA0932372.1 AtpZ/AtpI family protein [Lutimonas saemankumensis]